MTVLDVETGERAPAVGSHLLTPLRLCWARIPTPARRLATPGCYCAYQISFFFFFIRATRVWRRDISLFMLRTMMKLLHRLHTCILSKEEEEEMCSCFIFPSVTSMMYLLSRKSCCEHFVSSSGFHVCFRRKRGPSSMTSSALDLFCFFVTLCVQVIKQTILAILLMYSSARSR